MASKKKRKDKTDTPPAKPELDLGAAPGVAILVLPEIAKAIDKYEVKKKKRCEASPGEIAAKQELHGLLHTHREKLPLNGEGCPFYRHDGVDYILEEKLKRVSAEDAVEV